ncbi:hypothetical protein K443DRAFT_674168 [Laccaria amethystina LaAM-08-1]|uniref:RING-type domain-containing protein n=1 Tax=Laccaria amethystina LaAM-08-1 TaxID=1095629 RepID=A0A0C9XY37_9AGAR|nr:hypothetical protein K443DRAFT_674168 [Laccaria amethystina LaAM-08-1]
MGNSSSSSTRAHQDDTVDFGSLVPQGVYTGPRDWNQPIVSQHIVARKLAPFYRPLEEYDPSWDDDQILAARKELPESDNADTATRIEAAATAHSNASKSANKRPGLTKESSRPEAAIYRGAVECPICFLYYPPNINHSRCCDQAICTECFVQIKRAEPTTTHLVSEPAACPYCVQDNFGIVYTPPPWRAGIGSEGSSSMWSLDSPRSPQSIGTSPPFPTHKRRQKSFGADSPEVVTTDQIRPDWEAKLAAVRAAVARRANRRIIMRQVGDRLIPVGVGRIQTPEEAAVEATDAPGSRRSRRRQQQQNGNFEQFVGMGNQDLEELMLMEAMRLSLIDHEEHQRKEAEEKKKQAEVALASGATPASDAPSEIQAAPGPGPSTIEARLATHSSISSNLSSSPASVAPISSGSSANSQHGSQDGLAPSRKSWSISRSRTPPPPSNDDQLTSSRRKSTAGAPPFSALSTALVSASTSTASAFLGGPIGPDGTAPSTSAANGVSLSHADRGFPPIPTITVDDNHTPHPSQTPPDESSMDPTAVTSTSSSMFFPDAANHGPMSYGELPSSPESDISHEPLITRRREPETIGKVVVSGFSMPGEGQR